MQERVVNIFVYGDAANVHSMGYCTYMAEGTYEELTAFLRSRVHVDQGEALRFELDQPLTHAEFASMGRLGVMPNPFPGDNPIGDSVYCITHIINGMPRVDGIADPHAPNAIPDYLRIYCTAAGLDLTQLITDDFLDSVDLLWKHHKYISALKLLVSTIDTLDS